MGLLSAALLTAVCVVALSRGVLGDYVLQRSWPTSANCDAAGTGAPTFSYADESSFSNGRCIAGSSGPSNTYSSQSACYNATHKIETAWTPSQTCSGSIAPGYPQVSALTQTTNGCLADPGGSGASTLTTCIISTSRYTPPASEPNVAILYGNSSPANQCTVAQRYTASSSGALLPACAAIASLFAQPSNQSFASVSYTTTCTAAGAPSASAFIYFNQSSSCTGPSPASAPLTAFGTCLLVGDNLWWQQNSSDCSAAGGAAVAASTTISGGAIAGIIIAVLVVAGAAAAYFLGAFGGRGCKSSGKTIAIASTSTMNPVADASFRH